MNTWDQKRCNAANNYWIVLLTLFALAMLPGSSVSAYCQPANDAFADAELIASLPFHGTLDITDSTVEPGEQFYCSYSSRTVWYSLEVGSFDLPLTVNVNGSNFSDSTLTVYRVAGDGFDGLMYLKCAYWGDNITFVAKAGETYYIQAGSMYTTSGTLHMNVEEILPPANDNFADATPIGQLSFTDNEDLISASTEDGEPVPCNGTAAATVWYSFKPMAGGAISAYAATQFGGFVAVYTGDKLDALNQIACLSSGNVLTLTAEAGVTYYFQVGAYDQLQQGLMEFNLYVTPAPIASFGSSPSDPSLFDLISFYNSSYDPGQVGIESQSWNFGDGATDTAWSPTHQYRADGDYTVSLEVWTHDGRSASTSQIVQVKTHDVAITKFTAPSAAASRQTRTITVGINSKRYPENVEVQIMKSVPGYGYQNIGWVTQSVPVRSANRTTVFTFNYTFTSDDARIGKVTFRAVAAIVGARDALPGDNEAIALPTKVSR